MQIFKKSNNHLPKREYHDGDIVEFNFKPDSLDIHNWQEVTLSGLITGIIYGKNCIYYKIQLSDRGRQIFGDITVPETKINRKIDEEAYIIR